MTTTDGLSMTEEELEQVRLRTIAENSGNPDGEVPDDGQVDYFEPYGGKQRDTVTLPDGHSWIEFKIFNEGERKEFLNKTNRDMTITGRGKASMREIGRAHV